MLATLERSVHAPARPYDPRAQRRQIQHRNMRLALNDFIYSRSELVALGGDPVIEQLMMAAGFQPFDYFALRFACRGVQATALVLPSRILADPQAKALVMELKREARKERTRCIIVAQRSIHGNLRGRTAATIAKGRGARYLPMHVNAVIDHVQEARISTIHDCAMSIPHHADPVGVVLALVARGFLDVDRTQAVDCSSWVTTSL